MAIAFVAMLGILWHVALLLINDGMHRRRYRAAVRAIANLPLDMQSVERDDVMRRHRWPLTPFGRAFSNS